MKLDLYILLTVYMTNSTFDERIKNLVINLSQICQYFNTECNITLIPTSIVPRLHVESELNIPDINLILGPHHTGENAIERLLHTMIKNWFKNPSEPMCVFLIPDTLIYSQVLEKYFLKEFTFTGTLGVGKYAIDYSNTEIKLIIK